MVVKYIIYHQINVSMRANRGGKGPCDPCTVEKSYVIYRSKYFTPEKHEEVCDAGENSKASAVPAATTLTLYSIFQSIEDNLRKKKKYKY